MVPEAFFLCGFFGCIGQPQKEVGSGIDGETGMVQRLDWCSEGVVVGWLNNYLCFDDEI